MGYGGDCESGSAPKQEPANSLPGLIVQIPGYSLQLTQISGVGCRTLKTKARAHARLSLFIFFVILAKGRGGTEESAVPLARDLHPEFGYIGNAPAVLRKLGFATAFVAFGLIAAISNFSVFVTQPDDPLTAMALAPEQAFNSAAPAAPTLPVQDKSLEASFTEKAGAASRPCGGAITADSGVDCTPTRMHRSRSVQSVNERPAIAAIAIGHRDESAVSSPEPAASVVGAPTIGDLSATPPDAPAEAAVAETPPVQAVTPAAPAKKSRARNNSNQHRERSEYARAPSRGPAYSYHSMQGGYARVW
jgi:hypothetical protein